MEFVHQEPKRHQPVDDRRHTCQIGDIDFNQVGHPILRGVLLQIDGSPEAKRHRRERGEEHNKDRSDPCAQNAGLRGKPRRIGGEKLPGHASHAVEGQLTEQGQEHEKRGRHHAESRECEQAIMQLAMRDPSLHGICVNRLDDIVF